MTLSNKGGAPRRFLIAAHLHAAAFALTLNPVAALPAPVKFGSITALTIAATLTLYHPQRNARLLPPRTYVAWAAVLGIAALRSAPSFDEAGINITLLSQTQTGVSMLLIFTSFCIASVVGIRQYVNALRWWVTAAAAWLAVAVRGNLDRLDEFQVGDFGSASYLKVGQLFALAVLLHASQNRRWWRSLLMAAAAWIIYQNRARGETVAVLAGLVVNVAPRASILAGVGTLFAPGWMLRLGASTGATGLVRLQQGVEAGSLGERDALARQALSLIDHPTVLAGRGANWFQHIQHTPFGHHPHNQFIEVILVSGAPGLIVMGAAYVWPVVQSIRGSVTGAKPSPFLGVCVYFLVVLAKSGTLTVSWQLAVFAPLFYELTNQIQLGRDQPQGDHCSMLVGLRDRNIVDL